MSLDSIIGRFASDLPLVVVVTGQKVSVARGYKQKSHQSVKTGDSFYILTLEELLLDLIEVTISLQPSIFVNHKINSIKLNMDNSYKCDQQEYIFRSGLCLHAEMAKEELQEIQSVPKSLSCQLAA